MDIVSGFFYVFSAVLLYAALRVVTAKNPVHAVLYLVLSFSQASALWMLLGAEFLSIVLMVVYVGAVMVLFLFVVMMLDIGIDDMRRAFWRNLPLALLLGGVVAVEMVLVVFGGFGSGGVGLPGSSAAGTGVLSENYSNTKALGVLMYSAYVYPIQIAAILLLVAMLAAIALTLRGQRKESRAVAAQRQIQVRASDRLAVVQIPAHAAATSATASGSDSDGVAEQGEKA